MQQSNISSRQSAPSLVASAAVINTDTHTLANFEDIHLGVATARRAWIEKKDVWNALPLKQLLKRLGR